MSHQMDETDVASRRLGLREGDADGPLIGGALGEETRQPGLGRGQPAGPCPGLAQHRFEEAAHARFLRGGDPELARELEHVQRPRIAILVGGEGETRAPPVGEHLIDLALKGLDASVGGVGRGRARRMAVARRLVAVSGLRDREADEEPEDDADDADAGGERGRPAAHRDALLAT
jgi:hypothetical protein